MTAVNDPTFHESLGIQATMRRCCFGVNRIIMVVAVDRAKIPLTGSRQAHSELGHLGFRTTRTSGDMMTNTVEEVIPEVEPQYPKLSRLLHKVFENASQRSRHSHHERRLGVGQFLKNIFDGRRGV